MQRDRESSDVPARRRFLKTAGVLAVGTATVAGTACDVKEPAKVDEPTAARRMGFDRSLLDALAATVLPASLGADGVRAATDRFVRWADGYEPVPKRCTGMATPTCVISRQTLLRPGAPNSMRSTCSREKPTASHLRAQNPSSESPCWMPRFAANVAIACRRH